MFKRFIAILGLIFGLSSTAKAVDINQLLVLESNKIFNQVSPSAFDFKKGDFAKYSLTIGGFINGSMEMNVLDVISEGVWIQQLVDLGFAGKQDMRQLMDPLTGEIKKFIVNGKEQAPPDRGQVELVDQREETIDVPAGRFDCVYIKAKIQAEGKTTESEQWINPRDVAVMGLVKMASQTQFGQMTALLKSFKKN